MYSGVSICNLTTTDKLVLPLDSPTPLVCRHFSPPKGKLNEGDCTATRVHQLYFLPRRTDTLLVTRVNFLAKKEKAVLCQQTYKNEDEIAPTIKYVSN